VGQLANTFSESLYPTALKAHAGGYVANHGALLPKVSQVGHISPIIDSDGKVRRVYPVICTQGECSMALSLRLWQSMMQAGQLTWQSSSDRRGSWLFDAQPDTRIPVDQKGAMWIPYRVPVGGFQYVSASDVLKGEVPKKRLENLIVLVGSTALGLGDRVTTPLDSITPGLEIHAQIMSALLDRTLWEVKSASWWQMLLIYGFATSLLWFWPARGQKALIAWVMTLSFIWMVGVLYVTLRSTWVIAITPSLLWIVLVGFFWFSLESARLSRQLSHVATQFSHFLPASLVKRVLQDPEVKAKSERQTLTVLVADMRGFTTACEGKSPEVAALLAQQCLSVLSAEVARHQGTIEKYTGDGLMAMWGAPFSEQEHAKLALNAAKAMRLAVDNMQPWLAEHGFDPMRVSVGINTGEMAVGLFGSQSHLAWTAQGDAVNLANRIEQLTRTVGRDLLLGEMTAQLVGIEYCEHMGTHMVKGRSQPVAVYALLSI
jgi:adenylate cyclase